MEIIADTNMTANGCGCHKSLSPPPGCIFSCLRCPLKGKNIYVYTIYSPIYICIYLYKSHKIRVSHN